MVHVWYSYSVGRDSYNVINQKRYDDDCYKYLKYLEQDESSSDYQTVELNVNNM